jgi:hypothetical protein
MPAFLSTGPVFAWAVVPLISLGGLPAHTFSGE